MQWPDIDISPSGRTRMLNTKTNPCLNWKLIPSSKNSEAWPRGFFPVPEYGAFRNWVRDPVHFGINLFRSMATLELKCGWLFFLGFLLLRRIEVINPYSGSEATFNFMFGCKGWKDKPAINEIGIEWTELLKDLL